MTDAEQFSEVPHGRLRELRDTEQRVAIARIVAGHKRARVRDVLAALHGETDPNRLGLSGEDAERVRAIVEGRYE